jgi:hypothetical protein
MCSHFGQKVFTLWTECVHTLDRTCSHFGQNVFALWTECVPTLDRKCSHFGQNVFTLWTECVHTLDRMCSHIGQNVFTLCYGQNVFTLWTECVHTLLRTQAIAESLTDTLRALREHVRGCSLPGSYQSQFLTAKSRFTNGRELNRSKQHSLSIDAPLTYSQNSPHLIQLKVSLLYFLQTAMCSHPERNQSNQSPFPPTILFLSDLF